MKKFICLAIAALCMGFSMTSCNNDEPEVNKGFTAQGHEYVDLGLPSGLLWATCNLGASKPSDCGGYYSWGETTAKDSFSWDNYKYSEGRTCTKYNYDDNKMILEPGDDAVIANWGTRWRMPIQADFVELTECCTWEWQQDYDGIAGFLVIGPNGNSIFLPAAGCDGGESKGLLLYYWNTNLYTRDRSYQCRNGYNFLACEGIQLPYYFEDRYHGFPIRPVMDK